MSVLIETSLGDIVIDLLVAHAPRACENFLKLCKIKYYNGCLFHLVQKGRLVQTGDPTGTGSGGCSVFGLLQGERARFFEDELSKRCTHAALGTVSMATCGPNTNASQFVITTGAALHHLDETHTIFGRVAEGLDVLGAIDGAYADANGRPYQNIRIRHTIVLDDPYPDPAGLQIPDRSPEPTAEQLRQDRERLADDETLDDREGRTAEEIEEALAAQAAKSRAEVLEMLGDLPDADVAPPENVLFVCKLNPITQDDDLEIIFSRFGDIKKCEVIRDPRTGDSLNYAFIEFSAKEECEKAYLKMDGALIDDRRIRVDFSQSVAKTWNQYRRKEPMARLPGAEDAGGLGGGRGGGGGRGAPRPGGLSGGGRGGGAQQPRFAAAAAHGQLQGQPFLFDLPMPPPPPPPLQMAQLTSQQDGSGRARPSRWGERPAEPRAEHEPPRASDARHSGAQAPPPPPPRGDARRSRSRSSSPSSSHGERKRAKHHKKSDKADKRHKADSKAERSRDKHRRDKHRRSESDKHRRSDKHERSDTHRGSASEKAIDRHSRP